nr:potassium channel protein [Anaerolineae bacterium]
MQGRLTPQIPPTGHRPRRRRNESGLRMAIPLAIILITIITGTLGYWTLEGWPFVDAIYMTLITVTTIGYGVPYPLSYRGQVFTILLMVMTIGAVGYALSSLARFLFEGELNRLIQGRRMDRRIIRMKDHIILCGCGRTGRHIANEFFKTQTGFLIIEEDTEKIIAIQQTIEDIVYLQGDATQDDMLRLAGIERASGLIAALGDDKENLFIVLTARSMNSDLRIITRVSDDENAEKLLRAGADEVISPNAIGGLRMASVMLRPKVVTFLDQMLRVPDQTLRVDEIEVNDVPSLAGKTLAQTQIARRTGMLVVAILDERDDYVFNPDPHRILQPGDTLIVMGTPEQRKILRELGESGALSGFFTPANPS